MCSWEKQEASLVHESNKRLYCLAGSETQERRSINQHEMKCDVCVLEYMTMSACECVHVFLYSPIVYVCTHVYCYICTCVLIHALVCVCLCISGMPMCLHVCVLCTHMCACVHICVQDTSMCLWYLMCFHMYHVFFHVYTYVLCI